MALDLQRRNFFTASSVGLNCRGHNVSHSLPQGVPDDFKTIWTQAIPEKQRCAGRTGSRRNYACGRYATWIRIN
jgi:hypothetical protein